MSETPSVVQTRSEFSPFLVESKPLYQGYTGYWVVSEYVPFKMCCAERIVGYHLFKNDQEGFDPSSLSETLQAKYRQLVTKQQAFYMASKQVELLNQIFKAGFSIGQGQVEGYATGIRAQSQDIPVALSLNEVTLMQGLIETYKAQLGEVSLEGNILETLTKKMDGAATLYKGL